MEERDRHPRRAGDFAPFWMEDRVRHPRAGGFCPFWVQFVLLVAFETRFCELAQPVPPNAPKKGPLSDFLALTRLRKPLYGSGMLWAKWKALSGSHFFLTCFSRGRLAP